MSVTGDNKTGNFSSVYVSSNEQINGNLTVLGNITSGSGGSAIDLADGTAGAPSLSFANDAKTGLYRDTTGGSGIGFATNGTKRLKIYDTNTSLTTPLYIADGSNTAPSLALGSATNTGLFKEATSTLSFASNGNEVLRIGPSQIQTFEALSVGGSLGTNTSLTLPGSYYKVSDCAFASATSATALTWTNTVESNGSDITYSHDTTNGDTFTINSTGIYSVSLELPLNPGGNQFGFVYVTRNASSTVTIGNITDAQIVAQNTNYVAYQTSASAVVHLTSGDVLRTHAANGTIPTNNGARVFSIICLYHTTS